jgi:hypothetical protein
MAEDHVNLEQERALARLKCAHCPFGNLRAGCGLHSAAALRLGWGAILRASTLR